MLGRVMKHYELYDYFERKYKNLPAIQILDEMPFESFLDLLELSEIHLFYQQKFKGLWDRYQACLRIEDAFVNPNYIKGLLRNMNQALKSCMKAQCLVRQAGGHHES